MSDNRPRSSRYFILMLKKNVIKVIGETAMRVDPNLTREEKFQVFCNVVDGLLDDGRITKAQHHSWTHLF